MQHKQDILRKLPSVRCILEDAALANTNKTILKNIANEILDSIKNELCARESNKLYESHESHESRESRESNIKKSSAISDIVSLLLDSKIHKSTIHSALIEAISSEYKSRTTRTLAPVINASGVILQTNLGRSIFHPNLLSEIAPLLSHYSNLEYDLARGARGERYEHLDNMLCALFNVEASLIVNNNAAAVFLILNTFARERESIISRGEIIEIGGSFRMNEIMKSAGTILVEVGTTNKTKLSDYRDAISENTALILKAHKSNFYMSGFTQEVQMHELSELCKERGIIDYYDFGSGNFIIEGDQRLSDICQNPPSLLSFSGDKLFGSTQAGIILGKKDLIDKLKKNHLLRALRVDKTTILLLQSTLARYIENKFDEIPTLFMLSKNLDILREKADFLIQNIDSKFEPKVLEIASLAGAGSMPHKEFKSIGVALHSKSCLKLQSCLREHNLIARIVNNCVILDMRTIQDDEFAQIVEIFKKISEKF